MKLSDVRACVSPKSASEESRDLLLKCLDRALLAKEVTPKDLYVAFLHLVDQAESPSNKKDIKNQIPLLIKGIEKRVKAISKGNWKMNRLEERLSKKVHKDSSKRAKEKEKLIKLRITPAEKILTRFLSNQFKQMPDSIVIKKNRASLPYQKMKDIRGVSKQSFRQIIDRLCPLLSKWEMEVTDEAIILHKIFK